MYRWQNLYNSGRGVLPGSQSHGRVGAGSVGDYVTEALCRMVLVLLLSWETGKGAVIGARTRSVGELETPGSQILSAGVESDETVSSYSYSSRALVLIPVLLRPRLPVMVMLLWRPFSVGVIFFSTKNQCQTNGDHKKVFWSRR